MNTTVRNIAILFLSAIAFASCTPNNEEVQMPIATLNNVMPVNGKSFPADEAAQPITFRWTPLVPKPQQLSYRLKVWQLMQGQNGTQAMRSNPPIVTKDVGNVTEISVSGIYTGPCRPPYLCDFIWTVEAITPNGTATGEVIATSNPTVFNF